jgi:hypothetical protein
MITENLKEYLLSLDGSVLNFKGLVEFIERSDIEFIGCRIHTVNGVATHKKVFINFPSICNESPEIIYFIILHEYCHALRIDKMGKLEMIKMLSSDNFDEVFEHVINEEILADRYGSFMFHKFNKRKYPRYLTQELDLLCNQKKYRDRVGGLFGRITNDEEAYDKIVESFIIK